MTPLGRRPQPELRRQLLRAVRRPRAGKHFYFEFLPEVLEVAERGGRGAEWRKRIDTLLARDEHVWKQGLSPEEQRIVREGYKARYGEERPAAEGPGLHAVEERARPGAPGSGTGGNR